MSSLTINFIKFDGFKIIVKVTNVSNDTTLIDQPDDTSLYHWLVTLKMGNTLLCSNVIDRFIYNKNILVPMLTLEPKESGEVILDLQKFVLVGPLDPGSYEVTVDYKGCNLNTILVI